MQISLHSSYQIKTNHYLALSSSAGDSGGGVLLVEEELSTVGDNSRVSTSSSILSASDCSVFISAAGVRTAALPLITGSI